MGNDDKSSMSDSEIAKLLWDRWNHLERILVTTIFAMFITATVAIFAAATKLGEVAKSNTFTDNLFMVGAGAAYAILAGYYYFMLTQNYAAMVSLLQLDTRIVRKVSPLWEFFKPARAPVAGLRHQLQLLPAATVPLTITVVALIGIRSCLGHETPIIFWGIIAFHVALFFHMMWSPFRRFVNALRKITE